MKTILVNRSRGTVRIDGKVWHDWSNLDKATRRRYAEDSARSLVEHGDGYGNKDYFWKN